MYDELDAHLHVGRVDQRQFHADLEHVLAEERHPAGTVGLLQVPPGRQRGAAVEDPDVVEPQEAALEDVAAAAVLAVHPPGEVEQQLLEGSLEPVGVAAAMPDLLQTVREDGREGMDRRIHVTEGPLVAGNLAAGGEVRATYDTGRRSLAARLVPQR